MPHRSLLTELVITYETGTDEPLHPDPVVASRFIEVAMSNCAFGCKIFADPMSRVNVLGHYAVYGCKYTKDRLALVSV
jgi:hypothetical protein